MNFSVLVLNASYEAINICNVRRAIKMLVNGVACAEKESDMEIRSPSVRFRIPSVIRLFRYVRIPRQTVKFSRRNVLLRDQHTCQYCGNKFPAAMLTLDHIEPSSRGGVTSWENVVAACRRCNVTKGNRTPREARMMPLRKRYKAPHIVQFLHLSRYSATANQAWREYLFIK